MQHGIDTDRAGRTTVPFCPVGPIGVGERRVVGGSGICPFGVHGTGAAADFLVSRFLRDVENSLRDAARQPDIGGELILIGGLRRIRRRLSVAGYRPGPDGCRQHTHRRAQTGNRDKQQMFHDLWFHKFKWFQLHLPDVTATMANGIVLIERFARRFCSRKFQTRLLREQMLHCCLQPKTTWHG